MTPTRSRSNSAPIARWLQEGEVANAARERALANAWESFGLIVEMFFTFEQVIDHESTGFIDTCLVCGRDSRPQITVTEGPVTRGYYKCELQHPSGELAAWWTDWESSEVMESHVTFTLDLVGAGTIWSTVELGKRRGDEVSDPRFGVAAKGGCDDLSGVPQNVYRQADAPDGSALTAAAP